MPAATYSVTLHHLSSDAKMVNHAYPEVQLPTVSNSQLRDLLYGLSTAAERLTIYEPASPEIRIKTDRDAYVVRTRYRRLFFVGHETILRGEEHTVGHILTEITGAVEPDKIAPRPVRPTSSAPMAHSRPPIQAERVPRWAKIASMSVLIVGFNATAVWMLMRPPATLAPHYELLPDAESKVVLTRAAGEYRTGSQEGDRRLMIGVDGTLRLAKFGAGLALTDEGARTARGGLAQGRTVRVTNDPYVLAIRDADTVVLYGSTYHRHNP